MPLREQFVMTVEGVSYSPMSLPPAVDRTSRCASLEVWAGRRQYSGHLRSLATWKCTSYGTTRETGTHHQ